MILKKIVHQKIKLNDNNNKNRLINERCDEISKLSKNINCDNLVFHYQN